MTDPIATYLRCSDPITRAGLNSQLHCRAEVRIIDSPDADPACVAVVVTEELDNQTARDLKSLVPARERRALLVATRIDDAGVLLAAEVGVGGFIRRADATSDNLVAGITHVAAGHGVLPPDLLGRLLQQVGQLQRQVPVPGGLALSGLTARECEVLQLVAEGHDTTEIASRMCYSERTVKKILHDLTTRLHLKNRAHLIAYAMREGLI